MSEEKKTCNKCGDEKPLNDFYDIGESGKLGACKECVKLRVRLNRRSRIDYYREFDRKRGNRQPKDYVRNYRKSNPLKYRAHSAVNNAVRDGRLFKWPCCQHCGETHRIVAHHPAYDLPLVVTWLCAPCHMGLHRAHERMMAQDAA